MQYLIFTYMCSTELLLSATKVSLWFQYETATIARVAATTTTTAVLSSWSRHGLAWNTGPSSSTGVPAPVPLPAGSIRPAVYTPQRRVHLSFIPFCPNRPSSLILLWLNVTLRKSQNTAATILSSKSLSHFQAIYYLLRSQSATYRMYNLVHNSSHSVPPWDFFHQSCCLVLKDMAWKWRSDALNTCDVAKLTY